jgi:hypothetical protein
MLDSNNIHDGSDVPRLLTRRKHKHLVLRGIALLIDVALLVVAMSLLVGAFGEHGAQTILPVMAAYFLLMEWQFGYTLGKRIFELRVVGATGTKPTFGQSLIRNILRPFEISPIVGVVVAAATDKGQRIGDLLASTFVVRGNELQELSTAKTNVETNQLRSSREMIPLTPKALEVAKKGIASSYDPRDVGLFVIEDSKRPLGLAVQYDLIDDEDDHWCWTKDGVTVSVPRRLAERCTELMIDAEDESLVVIRRENEDAEMEQHA